MKLIQLDNEQSTVILSKDELYIIRSIIGEIYSGVCVDSEEFEMIHGIEKDNVLKLKYDIYEIYDQLK
ncbi:MULTISPECIES: hypothetical protein [unclassified Gilliamella]|jgi:hypothetical protein|uniref:hypothetical protein n=1 Tax=unclassified Gilliamella TaxID=2685620 RepID=UPI00080D9477|nr:hypothetical protein [Gilliamella apicola]OCG35828.1 hypothetical protein A9G32_06285 [Gilliamella apicola]OCG48733.1 hypothetical protein A9G26_10065 [Gilliamella apicola]OCG48854.1 hypothetical protein A9G27_03710 [Gilliamella apicola]